MESCIDRKSQRSHTSTLCTTDYVILQHGWLDIVYTRMWMIDCSAKDDRLQCTELVRWYVHHTVLNSSDGMCITLNSSVADAVALI